MPTTVITGAGKGIGLELVRQLAARGEHVYALVRKTNDALAAVEGKITVVENVDVTAANVGDVLRSALKDVTVDCLVNNAGGFGSPPTASVQEMFQSQSLEACPPETMRAAFDLNTVAPLVITQALLPQMSSSAKIIIITSLMGSIADNGSSGAYAYRASKAAVNMVGKSLAVDLKPKGISVGLVHPGMVATSFAGDLSKVPEGMRKGMHDVESSVRGVVMAIDATTLETTGSFVHANYGEVSASLREGG